MVEHDSLPGFILNNSKNLNKLKTKKGFDDFDKAWMVCYRCGECLTKDKQKLLEHINKKHHNGDDRVLCHYCPKKFFSEDEAFNHAICWGKIKTRVKKVEMKN